MRALPLLVLASLLAGCSSPTPEVPEVVPGPKIVLVDPDANELVAVGLPDLQGRQREVAGLEPSALSAHPNGRHLLVTNRGSNLVRSWNASTLGPLEEYVIAVHGTVAGNQPSFAAASPDGREVWASVPAANAIARFSFVTRAPLASVALPFAPGPFAFAETGDAWVVEEGGPRVAIVDRNRTVADVLEVGRSLRDVEAREHLVFAVDQEAGLLIFWAENRTLRDTADAAGYERIAMSGDGTALALAAPSHGRVLLFDGPRQVFKPITLGGRPNAVAFWDERGWLIVGSEGGRVVVADADGRILADRTVGGTFVDALVVP